MLTKTTTSNAYASDVLLQIKSLLQSSQNLFTIFRDNIKLIIVEYNYDNVLNLYIIS